MNLNNRSGKHYLPFSTKIELLDNKTKEGERVFLRKFIFNNVVCSIEETEECYVSPWSETIISAMPDELNGMTVCDYGAGTGIIAIKSVLTGAKCVTAIENDSNFRELLYQNIKKNNLDNKIDVMPTSQSVTNVGFYDYIVCNPACYPSLVGTSSFYHGGEMGTDMIHEVFLFASKTLKSDGHLLILIPSILPTSLVMNSLNELGMCAKLANDSENLVPLRKSLVSKLIHWVDINKEIYPEMNYYKKNSEFYEKVYLYNIHFCDNLNTKY